MVRRGLHRSQPVARGRKLPRLGAVKTALVAETTIANSPASRIESCMAPISFAKRT